MKPMNSEERRKQQREYERTQGQPINRFLNAVGEDGKLKYRSAELLRKYYLANPDPVLDKIRLTNALVHELRFHKNQASVYLAEHLSDVPKLKTEYGQPMSREQCYLKYIVESHAQHATLSKLRDVLAHQLMVMCDGDLFTFDQFDQYVLNIEIVVRELGFELFPVKVELIQPL